MFRLGHESTNTLCRTNSDGKPHDPQLRRRLRGGEVMAKRFTDTEKWRDPWFCSLSCDEKIFWVYLLDNCNMAGIWQVNWPLVRFFIPSFEFREENFKDRIVKINDAKWHIPKFIRFQYGELQETNRMHQRIRFELLKEGVSTPLTTPIQGVKDKEKERESLSLEDGGVGEETKPDGPTPQDLIALWNKQAHPIFPRVEILTETRKTHAKCRLQEHPNRGFWEDLVARINRSPHLRGENGRNWKASFDWILNVNNMAKILEGNYDPR